MNISSGSPLTLTTGINNHWGLTNNFPVLHQSLPKDFGKVKKSGLAPGVITYFDGLQPVNDPIRATVTTLQSTQGASANYAINDAQGKTLLSNPVPGTVGNLRNGYLEGPGNFGLDANLTKVVRIDESKTFELRLDAINVLNHPNFGNPTASINSTTFGRINLPTTGNRQFVFNARLSF